MEVHQGEVRLALFQQPVRRGEGVPRLPVQITAADEVHHPDPDAAQVEYLAAVARGPARVVGGPQQPGRLVQQVPDLHFPEGVVAQRHRVGAGVVDAPRLLLRHAHAGGVLAVHHRKGDVLEFL